MGNNKVVYINKTIDESNKDYLGVEPQVDSIITAVDKGAKMIGVIADYGSGKSTLAEMIKKKAKNKKIIKVNMWGNIEENKSEDSVTSMDKSLLYQIAKNSGNSNLAKHVNKRLNPNNGFISIALKSWTFWIWFIVAIIFLVAGILVSSSNFVIKINDEWTVGNGIYVAAYIASAIVLIAGVIRSGGLAYSSWKSEGEKKFDESNLFSIFNEIIDDIKSNNKTIIVIEDLDRVDKPERVLSFIKEVYRFSSLCQDKGIVFMVAIKPKEELLKNNNEKIGLKVLLDYEKIFDYMVELKPIHIQDFDAILRSLINENNEQLHELLGKDLNVDIYPDFSILAEGKDLTIRVLKHRLNNAILLFDSIKNKQVTNQNIISMKTCCVVSYLQSQYEKEFYLLVNSQGVLPQIIEKGITLLMDNNIAKEKKVSELYSFISNCDIFNNNKNEVFFNRLAQYVINGDIKGDYREYFYSYPKGSYIQCKEETELQEILLFPYDKNITDDRLSIIVDKNIELKCMILKNTIKMVQERGFNLPLLVIRNEKLLDFCYNNFPDFLIKTLVDNLLWTKESANKTVDSLVTIINYKSKTTEKIIEAYVEQTHARIGELGQEALECRLLLLKAIKDKILLFKKIYFEKNSPILCEDEINKIENEDVLFELVLDEKVTKQFFVDLSNRINNTFNLNNKSKLERLMELFVTQYPSLKPDTTIALLSLLKVNKITNDKVFSVIAKSYNKTENHEALIQYLNNINTYSDKYLEEINRITLVDKMSEALVSRLFENKYYKLYLFNKLYNDYDLTEKDYNIEIFNNDIINKLFSFNSSLFANYREKLLLLTEDIKENYKFIFSPPYTFVSEKEKSLMKIQDCKTFFSEQNIEANIEAYVQLLLSVIKSSKDIFEIANYVLSLAISSKVKIFSQLPFKQFNYCYLGDKERKTILDLYRNFHAINSANEILKYMELTGDLNDILEQELLEYINKYPAENIPETIISQYAAILNQSKKFSNIAREILNLVNYKVGLKKEITDDLMKSGEVKGAIIAETLYNNKFIYNPSIELDVYYEIYTSVGVMDQLMQAEKEFLVKIYQAKKYDKLSYKQLLCYNSWGHNKELILALFDRAIDDESRKKYFLNIPKMETQEDCDTLYQVFNENDNKYKYLLADKDICDHAKYLVDKSRTKGFFTRLFNKLSEANIG